MILRNSIRSNLRARGRTALFALLICIVTAALSLGMGMWAHCARMLADMDAAYTSIALAEYMGDAYPDDDAFDPGAREAVAAMDGAAIADLPGVIRWEATDRTAAHITDFVRGTGHAPYADAGVVVVSGITDLTGEYTGLITRSLYTYDGKDNLAVILDPGETDFVPQRGTSYVLHGKFTESRTSNRTFSVTAFHEGCEEAPWRAVEGSADPAAEEGLFGEYARFYRMANNCVTLRADDDIASMEIFQQGHLTLQAGRFPGAGEPGTCLVSGDIALAMDLAVGDTIELRIMQPGEESLHRVTATGDIRTLEVVGITAAVRDLETTVWVSGAEGGFDAPFFGCQAGRAVLENDGAVETAEVLQAMMPAGVRITLYDQGYAAAARPLRTMETTAAAITAASALGALAVLFLFAFLFVGRQQETVSVMVSLGTPRRKIRLWLMAGAGLIAGVSAALGALVSAPTLGWIISLSLDAARQMYAVDRRYSEAAIGIVREAAADPATPLWPAAAAGVAVTLAALVLCAAFLSRARKQATPRRGRVAVRTPRGMTSVRGEGPMRFAVLSARRGGWRGIAAVGAALALSLLMGSLAAVSDSWNDQLTDLYAEAEITGQVTSTNGRQSTRLVVPIGETRRLWQTWQLGSLDVASPGFSYYFAEDMPAFGEGSFAYETMMAWIARQPDIVAVSSLDAAPAYAYSPLPEIAWLEGWDAGAFARAEAFPFWESIRFVRRTRRGSFEIGGREAMVYPCLVSEEFLADRGAALGETVSVTMHYADGAGDDHLVPVTLRPVGSYPRGGAEDAVYVPLGFWVDPAWVTGEERMETGSARPDPFFRDEAGRDLYAYMATSFSVCRFTLWEAEKLEEFRDVLSEEGYSQVGKLGTNRITVLLRDQTFVETVGGLSRYISFGRILFPVLYAAVGLLGFVISWLLVSSRRMEFAVMRGLGASGGRVFASFFGEQALLCLAGSLIGCVLPALATGGWDHLPSTGIFVLCYLAGCALSVIAAGRTPLMSLLSERE